MRRPNRVTLGSIPIQEFVVSLVEYSTEGAVAVVRLARPPVNALSEELSNDLAEAFGQAAGDDVRAVIVTGAPHFAAGADIKGFQESFDAGRPEDQDGEENTATALVDAVWKLERLAKPTIAAIHGYALGGGLELAMGADFRYLADDAQVGQPEIKLGIIPGAGGTQRLPRIVGYQKAKEIVFTGRFVSAAEALEIGLADKVVPSDELFDTAMKDAQRWAKGPTKGYAAAKRALADGWGKPMVDAMDVEAAAFQDCFWTEDAQEGVAAFIDKREANFRGE